MRENACKVLGECLAYGTRTRIAIIKLNLKTQKEASQVTMRLNFFKSLISRSPVDQTSIINCYKNPGLCRKASLGRICFCLKFNRKALNWHYVAK